MTEQYTQISINNPRQVRILSISTQLDLDDGFISATGAITLTLPSADQIPGFALCVKSNDGLTTVAAQAGENIDGAATFVFSAAQESLCLQSDGINWRIISNEGTPAPAPSFTVTAIQIALFAASIGEIVRCDPTAGGFVVTLPAIAAGNSGQQIVVKNVSTSINTITVTPTGDTIDGIATFPLAASFGSATFVSDGTGNWMVI